MLPTLERVKASNPTPAQMMEHVKAFMGKSEDNKKLARRSRVNRQYARSGETELYPFAHGEADENAIMKRLNDEGFGIGFLEFSDEEGEDDSDAKEDSEEDWEDEESDEENESDAASID